VLEPDVAAAFPGSAEADQALRALAGIIEKRRRAGSRRVAGDQGTCWARNLETVGVAGLFRRMKNPFIQYRQLKQSENRRTEQTSYNDGRERALNFRPGRCG